MQSLKPNYNTSIADKLISLKWLIVKLLMIGSAVNAQSLKVGVVGLSHDHAHGVMNQFKKGEVTIVGIVETDNNLIDRYKKRYQLAESLFYKTTEEMITKVKPEAVLAYNAIADHLAVVEACAPKKISVMVEKPLATTVKDAERIVALAKEHNIHVLTNYETTWYPSNQQIHKMVHQENAIGNIRKMVVHDGHQGPKEIGCSPEFLAWLTDPVKNGGGALTDFGEPWMFVEPSLTVTTYEVALPTASHVTLIAPFVVFAATTLCGAVGNDVKLSRATPSV